NWLASVPPGAASPSVIGACMLAFGIAFVVVGVYGFRGHPSKRVIESWARLDGYANPRNVLSCSSTRHCNSPSWSTRVVQTRGDVCAVDPDSLCRPDLRGDFVDVLAATMD